VAMKSTRSERAVGFLVILGTAAILMSVIFIGQEKQVFERRVSLQTQFSNAGGLAVGAEVRLSGILVGSVKFVGLTDEGNVLVEMEIRRSVFHRIHEDSRALVKTIGLLGDNYVDVSVGGPESPPVAEGAMITGIDPVDIGSVIAEAGPTLDDIGQSIANVRELTRKLADEDSDIAQLLSNLRKITDSVAKGQGTVGKIIQDDEAYNELIALVQAARDGTKKFGEAAERANNILAEAEGDVDPLLSDTRAAAANVRDVAATLQESLESLPGIMKDLEKSAYNLEVFLGNLVDVSEDLKLGSPRIPEMLAEGQTAISEAREVIAAARANPLLRRYFEDGEPSEPLIVHDRPEVEAPHAQ